MSTITHVSDNTVSSYKSWLVVFSAALFFFYEFIQMHMFNAISHDLMQDFKMNATMLGYVSASYFYADVLFLIPAGMLLDRLSTRKIILTAMLICVVSTALFARSTSILVVALCHFAAGIGNAFCFLSCIRLASRWFSSKRMALIVGLIVTMAMLGGIVAQTPMAWLTHQIGWRHALMATAALGSFIIIIVWFFVQDYPENKAQIFNSELQKLKSLGVWNSMRLVLRNPQNWFAGFYTSFMNLPLMLLGGLWGNLYLTTVHHINEMQASYITSMLFFGTIIGCPTIGWLSDRLSLRRLPMIIFATLAVPPMLGIIYLSPLSVPKLLLLFFALGLFTAAQTISYPLISESNDKSITSSAMGLASALIMGAPAVFEPIYGWLMDKNWDGALDNSGAHIYSSHAYYYPMFLLFCILFIGLLSSLFVKETYAYEKLSHDKK